MKIKNQIPDMKNFIILIIVILTVTFHLQSDGQIRKAERHVKYYHFSKAIPVLLKTADSDNENMKNKAIPLLAHCYRLTNNMPEARVWYEQAVQIEGADPICYYYLGQAYRSLGMYDEAAGAFSTFNAIYPDSLDVKKFNNYSVEIKDWLNLPPMAEINNVQMLNSRYSDFGPVFYKKGIVFTSDRKKNSTEESVYGWTNFGYLNMMFAQPEYAGNWLSPMTPPEEMKNNFNQKYHDGPAVFSNDFKRVYITRTVDRELKRDNDNIRTSLLKIYYADIDEGKKLRYKSFPFNNKNYSVGHPTLSADNNRIIFSSDMPGGFGGSDLYISTRNGDTWSKPVNLGACINTKGNEVFPCWVADTILFFSSEERMGYGGLDIYCTRMKDSQWSEPINLKAPINSSFDDFGIAVSANLTDGLFSSNRPEGKGSDDIYAFRNLLFEHKKPFIPMVSGYVKDQQTLLPIQQATVFLFDQAKNEVRIAKTDSTGYFKAPAQYNRIYMAKAMKENYLYDCQTFRIENDSTLTCFKLPKDLLLSKLQINQITRLNIYYDLDKWDIKDEAKILLDSLVTIMKSHPITAELSSHTDSRASVEYNNVLSEKRAKSAVDYIISQGIGASRITSKGYGESKLVNHCADGVVCSEAEHAVNRRTEFRITSIDPQSFEPQYKFDLKLFQEDDVINPAMLEINFFGRCMIKPGSTN